MGYEQQIKENCFCFKYQIINFFNHLKGGWSAVGNQPIAYTLTRVYPNIGLEPSQFARPIMRTFLFLSILRFFPSHLLSFSPSLPTPLFLSLLLFLASCTIPLLTKIEMRHNLRTVICFIHLRNFKVLFSFPDIILTFLLAKHWDVVENRKAFFDDFATHRGFDPKSEVDWAKITIDDLLLEKVFLSHPPPGFFF